MLDSLRNLVQNTGPVNGYHVEHILGHNEENLRRFGADPEDPTAEQTTRSSSASGTGSARSSCSWPRQPVVGEGALCEEARDVRRDAAVESSLRRDFYKSKLKVTRFVEREGLALEAIPPPFDQHALEARTELLFDLVQRIWGGPDSAGESSKSDDKEDASSDRAASSVNAG